jgi:hypothetical protein
MEAIFKKLIADGLVTEVLNCKAYQEYEAERKKLGLSVI